MTAAAKGYHCIFTIPDKMSQEKIDMLKAYGAEVIVTATDLDHHHPDNYVEVAKRIASQTPNALYTDQYYNTHNPEAHYLTTGPEIWEATDGMIDSFVAGLGTGGTISGAGKYLKEKAKEVGRTVRVVGPDPHGSIYKEAFYKGEWGEPSLYRVEGIGHDFMVGTLDFSVVDEVVNVSDSREIIVEEGRVEFENISFHYGRTGGIIDNFTMSIVGGEKVGIVGRSGSGKSTLLNLILRFYDLESGRILIDGQDISRVLQESLRSNFGVVSQDT